MSIKSSSSWSSSPVNNSSGEQVGILHVPNPSPPAVSPEYKGTDTDAPSPKAPKAPPRLRSKLEIKLNIFCTAWNPILGAAAILLYVSPAEDWKAYPLVPTTFLIMVTSLLYGFILLWNQEWFRYLCMTLPAKFFSGTLIPFLMDMEEKLKEVRKEKDGKVPISALANFLICLSLGPLMLVFYYIYYNVDFFRAFKVMWNLLVTMFSYLTDPKKILKEFDELLQTLHLREHLTRIHTQFVVPILAGIHRGELSSLLLSLFAFIVLMVAGIMIYLCFYEPVSKSSSNSNQETKKSDGASSSPVHMSTATIQKAVGGTRRRGHRGQEE